MNLRSHEFFIATILNEIGSPAFALGRLPHENRLQADRSDSGKPETMTDAASQMPDRHKQGEDARIA